MIVNWPVAAVVPVAVICSGFGVHATPGGRVVQVTFTICVPTEPAPGVTVIVEEPLLPALTVVGVSAPAAMVKLLLALLTNVKLKMVFPPRAMGLGSAGPKELPMMK